MPLKPISISLGKPKAAAVTPSSSAVSSKPSPLAKTSSQKANSLLYYADSDPEDEPSHQEATITGFSSSGAVLAAPAPEANIRIIANPGNSDWRKRKRGQRSALPGNAANEVETKRVEVDEVSTASGLQLAPSAATAVTNGVTLQSSTNGTETIRQPEAVQTDDERALAALLSGDAGNTSTAVIAQQANRNLAQTPEVDEIADFRADVASRPDSCTLDEYAAMPVEEFGLAMLRGMGAKRKALGLPINLDEKGQKGEVKVREPRQGYLGIGAKAQPGMTEAELGAWGKTAMRKGMRNGQGEGMYTPVMLRDKRTGELVSEEDVERRRREESGGKPGDWRDRREKNVTKNDDVKMVKDTSELEALGSDYKKQMNGFSNTVRAERTGRSRSRRDRSRSGGSRGHEASGRDEQYRDRERDRRRDKYRDYDSRYDSSSSRRGGGRRDSDRERSRRAHDDDSDARRRRERY